MKEKLLVYLALVLFIGACAETSDGQEQAVAAAEMTEEELVAKAMEIHERVLTLDTHDDIPFNFATDEADPGVEGDRQVDIPKMKAGKLDVGTFIVYVGQTKRMPVNYEKAKKDAMTKFNSIHRMAEMYPDDIEVALTAADVTRIHESGKLVAAIAIENGYVIGKDLALIKKYKDLGANYMTLAHNGNNDISDSANPRESFGDKKAENSGISEYGEKVIAEMNRVGMLVDVSHISMEAAIEAAKLSKAPIIASHSSTKGIHDVPRNMSDEAMLALKETGGVINIVALDAFVKADSEEEKIAVAEIQKEYGIGSDFAGYEKLTEVQKMTLRKKLELLNEKMPGPNVADFVDHIDYAVNLLGIDHVGISSDFDGGGGIVGWDDASETPNVTIELVRRGYSEEDIAKLWSGNYLRVWAEAERIAGM